jgi:hypothetical protein
VVQTTEKETYVQSLFAGRLGGAMFGKERGEYKFEKIKRAKRAALAAHPGEELIDFGVGEPDEMAFPGVVKTLQEEAAKPENRGYADNGIQEFKDAAARYLQKVYGVGNINPETEVLHGIGSKPALAMVPAAFINPGDAHDRAGVPGHGHAHPLVRRRSNRASTPRRKRFFPGPRCPPARCSETGETSLHQLSEQSHRRWRNEGLF